MSGDYHSYNREAERQAFKTNYPKELKAIQAGIETCPVQLSDVLPPKKNTHFLKKYVTKINL